MCEKNDNLLGHRAWWVKNLSIQHKLSALGWRECLSECFTLISFLNKKKIMKATYCVRVITMGENRKGQKGFKNALPTVLGHIAKHVHDIHSVRHRK